MWCLAKRFVDILIFILIHSLLFAFSVGGVGWGGGGGSGTQGVNILGKFAFWCYFNADLFSFPPEEIVDCQTTSVAAFLQRLFQQRSLVFLFSDILLLCVLFACMCSVLYLFARLLLELS